MKYVKLFFHNFEEIICSIALSITIISVLINTLLGWVVGKRYGQLEELAITGFVWITFLGISLVYKKSNHIYIDFIVGSMPKQISKTIELAVSIFVVLVNLYIIYYALILTNGAIGKSTSLLHISYLYIDMSVVLGFALMTVHTVIDIIHRIKGWKEASQ